MQLILLAAGHGRRFGGLKQLAPVGPNGEALMDYTAKSALAAGIDRVIMIVRDDVKVELLDHVRQFWPKDLGVVAVTQGPVAGTAQAVLSAMPHVDGPFGVVNADDLYGDEAISVLVNELQTLDAAAGEQLIIAYKLSQTILTDDPVTRGVCEKGESGYLERIVEQKVQRENNGFFIGRDLHAGRDTPGWQLTGDEDVSMNLWGLTPGVLDHLSRAVDEFDPKTAPHEEGKPPEVLLPTVIGDLVGAGKIRVKVVTVEGRCVGITHPDDLELVRRMVAEASPRADDAYGRRRLGDEAAAG